MTPDAPTAPPRIEPASLHDIPTIIQLAEATWEPTYRFIISREQIEYMYRVIYTPASLKRQMAEQQHSFLLAYVAGAPLSAPYRRRTMVAPAISCTRFTCCLPGRAKAWACTLLKP